MMLPLSKNYTLAAKSALFYAIIFFMVIAAPSVGLAQQAGTDSTATEQTEQAAEQSPEKTQPEEKAQKKNKKADKKDKDKKSFLDKLMFWKKNKIPDQPSEWHTRVKGYKSAKQNEYFRYGYAQMESGEWVPVFFLRRFKMMQRQYEHILIIKGQPARTPEIKGVTMQSYGMEVTNQGFDFEIPKFASVARSLKEEDEIAATQIARRQLLLYGFDEVIWLRDEREELRDLADTWENQGNTN